MALEKHSKWAIGAAVSWTLFFIILFGGVIPKTALVQEYGCTVKSFNVDPRFECSTKCPVIPDMIDVDDMMELETAMSDFEDEYYDYLGGERRRRPPTQPKKGDHKHCDEVEKETLSLYSPKLCMKARWGFEDPLCPPEYQVCYVGHELERKCHLKCPLAYNITVSLDVDHIGPVTNSRDIGTNEDKLKSYKDEYKEGRHMSCQVIRDGSNNVRWVDERMTHKQFAWWKWSLFAGTMIMSLICTVASLVYYTHFKHRAAVVRLPTTNDDAVNDLLDPRNRD